MNKHVAAQVPRTSEASCSRRGFLQGVGGLSALAAVGGFSAGGFLTTPGARAQVLGPAGSQRRRETFLLRTQAAREYLQERLPDLVDNGDDARYADRRASFSKSLPHDGNGEVDPAVYATYLAALDSGDPDRMAAVPLSPGATARLANPQGAYAFQYEGYDSHALAMAAAPTFAGATTAAEMGEVYWKALVRDVPFTDFETSPLIAAAVADLNAFSAPVGPQEGGQVTPETVFRGTTPGDLTGPFVSQFLWKPFRFGLLEVEQAYRFPVPGAANDFMTTFSEWLSIQRGGAPAAPTLYEPTPRYITTGRDLAEYVHVDVTYQAYLNAALTLLGFGGAALAPTNPYKATPNQGGFVTFGPAEITDMVARACLAALKAAWFQKWLIHRRLRPEVYGGRVDVHVRGAKAYDLHPDFLASDALARVQSAYGSSLLPLAFPEGSPTHPAYPAGHATLSGACTTILKAFFDEDFVVPDPVVASADGTALDPWTGDDLTVGGELDKLAHNITLGRDWAGVHYRSDGEDGLRLGEHVGLSLLRDYAATYNEAFDGFELTTFDGERVRIEGSRAKGWLDVAEGRELR